MKCFGYEIQCMSSCIYHSKIYTETLFAAIASVFGINVRNNEREEERESRIAIPSELFSSSEMEMEIEIQVALLLICFPS